MDTDGECGVMVGKIYNRAGLHYKITHGYMKTNLINVSFYYSGTRGHTYKIRPCKCTVNATKYFSNSPSLELTTRRHCNFYHLLFPLLYQ